MTATAIPITSDYQPSGRGSVLSTGRTRTGAGAPVIG